MNIVFVQNILLDSDADFNETMLFPHLGLISLISVIESDNYNINLYDPMLSLNKGNIYIDKFFYSSIASEILAYNPDIVGFTALGCNFAAVVKIANELKSRAPNIIVLLGGPHATVLDSEIASYFSSFDIIVRHEAEEVIIPLLQSIWEGNIEKVPNITFVRNNKVIRTTDAHNIVDLDSLPVPAYHYYPIGDLNLKSMRIEAGRGCPFSCNFCSTASFFGRKFRMKSAERLCFELDILNKRYGISHFGLEHDLFTVNKKKVLEFCEAIEPRNYSWTCSARIDCVDKELLHKMKHAGCTGIYYGIESGSEVMQKEMNKNMSISLVNPIIDLTQKLKIDTTLSFIIGYPSEKNSDLTHSLNLIGKCISSEKHKINIQIHMLNPEPGTALIKNNINNLKYDGYISDFNFPPIDNEDINLIEKYKDVFLCHHYYETILPRSYLTFITSIFKTLQPLGNLLLSHISSLFGSFNNFISKLYNYFHSINKLNELSENNICNFFVIELGNNHYMTSLVRFYFTASNLRNTYLLNPDLSSNINTKICKKKINYKRKNFRLSDKVSLQYNLHNCPKILDRLEQFKHEQIHPIPYDLTKNTNNYLIYYTGFESDSIRTFELNEVSTLFIEFFCKNRSFQEVESLLFQLKDADKSMMKFWKSICEQGIVVKSNS